VGEINASSKKRSIGDKLDTPMVVVNVSVMDSHNQPIPDLAHEDFTIAEDGVQQQKAFFVGPDSPVKFSLAFDISSYEPLKLMAGQVAKDFVRQIRSTDDVAIPQLKITREVVRDFATDKKKLEAL
jgi:hypothetical protein